MGQYFNILYGDLNSLPVGWSQPWDTGGYEYMVDYSNPLTDRSFKHRADGTEYNGLKFDAVGTDNENLEILSLLYASGSFTGTGSVNGPEIILRCSGDRRSPYLCRFIFYYSGAAQDERVAVANVNGGSTSQIHTSSGAWNNNTWFWTRIQVNSGSYKMRWWDNGNSEPSTWQINQSTGLRTGSGWVGFMSRTSNGYIGYYAYMSVGTSGESAPYPPSGSIPYYMLSHPF